jgi:hypothetical protein
MNEEPILSLMLRSLRPTWKRVWYSILLGALLVALLNIPIINIPLILLATPVFDAVPGMKQGENVVWVFVGPYLKSAYAYAVCFVYFFMVAYVIFVKYQPKPPDKTS